MQKIATKVFVIASLLFGALGIAVVLTLPGSDSYQSSDTNEALLRFLFMSGFVVLSSFALSVASKYLNGKS